MTEPWWISAIKALEAVRMRLLRSWSSLLISILAQRIEIGEPAAIRSASR